MQKIIIYISKKTYKKNKNQSINKQKKHKKKIECKKIKAKKGV